MSTQPSMVLDGTANANHIPQPAASPPAVGSSTVATREHLPPNGKVPNQSSTRLELPLFWSPFCFTASSRMFKSRCFILLNYYVLQYNMPVVKVLLLFRSSDLVLMISAPIIALFLLFNQINKVISLDFCQSWDFLTFSS